MAWQDVLRATMQKVDTQMKERKVRWMVVGSTVATLHGVAGIVPNNVDVRTQTPEGIEAFREVLITYSLPQGAVPIGSALTEPLPTWRSNLDQQIAKWSEPNGGRYWLGRWPLGGGLLDVRYMEFPAGRDKLVEYYGEAVWEHVRYIPFEDWQVPTCPLEVHLAYVAKQGQSERVRKIAEYINVNGYDRNLLIQALRNRLPSERMGNLLKQVIKGGIEY